MWKGINRDHKKSLEDQGKCLPKNNCNIPMPRVKTARQESSILSSSLMKKIVDQSEMASMFGNSWPERSKTIQSIISEVHRANQGRTTELEDKLLDILAFCQIKEFGK